MFDTQILIGIGIWAAFTAVAALKMSNHGNFNPWFLAAFSAFVAGWLYFVWRYL